jgi:arabinose-5-phosphate isomerase
MKRQPIEVFCEALEEEAKAIARSLQRLDRYTATKAVDLVLGCQGKVVVIGVGKSGLIARKIAATLSSTGTTAAFMHASDALHGDLGLLTGKDVVIVLSHSGETDEVVALMPQLRRRKVHVIAITGNMRSSLAKDAEVVLDASVEREACPLNLAPTASTTVALAIGDALALAVALEKGYSPEDFGFNHPSGRLGKRLTLKVSDLMHHGANNPLVKPEATITEVILALGAFRHGAVNVINPEGKLVGVITEGDLRRALGRAPTVQWSTLGAAQIMTPNPTTASPDILAYDALRLMENRPSQISILPVVDRSDHCIGMIRLHDLVKAGL